MVLFETNCIAYLLLLSKPLGVITSASVDNSEISVDQNESQVKTISNKKELNERHNKEKKHSVSENKKTIFLSRDSTSSTSFETSPSASSTSIEETTQNKFNVIIDKPMDLSIKHRQNKNTDSSPETSKFPQVDVNSSNQRNATEQVQRHIVGDQGKSVIVPYVVNEPHTVYKNSINTKKYTLRENSNVDSPISTKRGIEHITTSSRSAFHRYCKNLNTSYYHDGQPIKKTKHNYISSSPPCVTEINPVTDNSFSSEDRRGFSSAKSDSFQANTQRNLPCSVSNFVNKTNHNVQNYNENIPVKNSLIHSFGSSDTELKDIPQCHPKNFKIKCLNTRTKERDDISIKTPMNSNICKCFIFGNKKFPRILCDTQHSLNKRTPDLFCDYLFSVNRCIFYSYSRGQGKRLIESIILQIDVDTNKNETQDPNIEKLPVTIVLCPQIEYKVPIFIPLNFNTLPNLQCFKLTTTKSDFGIICTVEVLVSFVGGVIPNMEHTFLIWGNTPYMSIFKFILSTKFPIYSFRISGSGEDSLWFSKKYSPYVGEIEDYKTIQHFFNCLETPSLDFERLSNNSHRYKEVKDLSTLAEETQLSSNIALCIIYKTCISFSDAFKEIQRIFNENPKTATIEQKKSMINLQILEILKNLEPNWCITYHEDVNFSDSIQKMLSFYSFFYYEVKYVLEYCLKYGEYRLVEPDQ